MAFPPAALLIPMSTPPQDLKRRAFLGDALKLGASSLLIGSTLNLGAKAGETPKLAVGGAAPAMIDRLPDLPARVGIDHDGSGLATTQRQGSRFTSAQGVVELVGSPAGLAVRVTCPDGLLTRVVL